MKRFALTRNGTQRGFALIAAIGTLAAMSFIVIAADITVHRGLRQSERAVSLSKNLEICEASAQSAVRAYLQSLKKGAEPRKAMVYEADEAKVAVKTEPFTETDALYSQSVFAYREGDFRVETQIEGKMRAVWLVNAVNGSKRVVLLEREA